MGNIRRYIVEYLEEENLRESGFARLKNAMHGLVDGIDTIGIVSAQNPAGKEPLTKLENKRRHEELKKKVRELGYGFMNPDYGMYGDKEKSLIIQNITKEKLVELSNFYEQESCIFGTKDVNEAGALFKWEYIKNGKVVGEETVYTSHSGSEVQDRKDYYTKHKGRKFVIPFFTDDEEVKQPLDKHRFKYKD